MLDLALSTFRYRLLIAKLVERDISGSYSGSVLGRIWAFIDPLIYVALTLVFFQFAIRGVQTAGVPYVAWVLPQIIFWTFISGVVNGSVTSIKEYSFLLRHKDFEARLIALIRLLSGLVIHLVLMFVVLVILYGFLHVSYGFGTLAMIYYLAAMCALLMALQWIVSALGVFLKDVKSVVGIIMQVEFWISPIFWNVDHFPKPIAVLMSLNPFYYPMNGYRQSLLSADFGPNFVILTIYFWAIVAALLFFGSRLFERLSESFGDVL